MPTTRVEDYLARVDRQLATLSAGGQREFLENLIDQWTGRYQDWQARVDRGAPTPAGATSFDYIETLAALEQRQSTATAEGRAEMARWHAAYRKSDAYRARAEQLQAAE